jgi:hypothetical protein
MRSGIDTTILTEAQAVAWLKECVKRYGGVTAFAKHAGVSVPMVSNMLRARQHITGKTAEFIGLRKVYCYELTLVVPSPLQEQYENERRKWNEEIGPELEHWNQKARGNG